MLVPRISVVVPAYNSAWSIGDTIRSVMAQTRRDFELLIVNDGSTDNLEEAIAPFAAVEPRLRIVPQRNGGLAAARNRGLAESRGEFVAFLDADDIWHPDFLKLLSAALESNGDAAFAYAHSFRIDKANRLVPVPHWRHTPRHDFTGLLTLNSVGNGSAALFRSRAVRNRGGFDVSLRERGVEGVEDWKLCLQLAFQHPPILVARYLVGYRLSENSMSQVNPVRNLRSFSVVIDDIRTEFGSIDPRHFKNARTLLNGWLLSSFLRKGEYTILVRLIAQSYLLNPLWFLSRDLRAVHARKIASLFLDLGERKLLAQLCENGARPFAFLDAPGVPAPEARQSSSV